MHEAEKKTAYTSLWGPLLLLRTISLVSPVVDLTSFRKLGQSHASAHRSHVIIRFILVLAASFPGHPRVFRRSLLGLYFTNTSLLIPLYLSLFVPTAFSPDFFPSPFTNPTTLYNHDSLILTYQPCCPHFIRYHPTILFDSSHCKVHRKNEKQRVI